MTRLLSVDPGLETGVALGEYFEDEPYRLIKTWQFGGGVVGLSDFLDWFESNWHPKGLTEVVCEKFTARQALTRKMEESLRGEGLLVGTHWIQDYKPGSVQWGQPTAQYFSSGKSLPLAEKKKRANAWLKEHDMYVTGKDVGRSNSDDARSAMLHAVAYMRRIEHTPTLKEYFS